MAFWKCAELFRQGKKVMPNFQVAHFQFPHTSKNVNVFCFETTTKKLVLKIYSLVIPDFGSNTA